MTELQFGRKVAKTLLYGHLALFIFGIILVPAFGKLDYIDMFQVFLMRLASAIALTSSTGQAAYANHNFSSWVPYQGIMLLCHTTANANLFSTDQMRGGVDGIPNAYARNNFEINDMCNAEHPAQNCRGTTPIDDLWPIT